MNKLTLCLLVLSIVAVYVDCASLKTSKYPYEESMLRFIDIVKVIDYAVSSDMIALNLDDDSSPISLNFPIPYSFKAS